MTNESPVVVVGAGLAGLSCAQSLLDAGIPTVVLEASNAPGGRVGTDIVDGYRLDRGFQVLLTAYPTAQSTFDLAALKLKRFYPGALIQVGPRRYRFADPWRKPLAALGAMLAPVATITDGWRIARMRADILRPSVVPEHGSARTTRAYLESRGLSARVIERFFQPFFGGVFLDRALDTPERFFRFVFAMFSRGHAALPELGMGQLADQLARTLPSGCLRLQTPVDALEGLEVKTAEGECLSARAIVIATDASSARRLIPELPAIGWNGTTTLYYAANRSPLAEAILVLNGNGQGLVNHVCVPSDVSCAYAPPGRALISVSVVGIPDLDDADLDRQVRVELAEWFGSDVAAWQRLKTYRIREALPHIESSERDSAISTTPEGVFLCGDYRTDPSIDGALRSGRDTAQRVIDRVRCLTCSPS